MTWNTGEMVLAGFIATERAEKLNLLLILRILGVFHRLLNLPLNCTNIYNRVIQYNVYAEQILCIMKISVSEELKN